MKTRTLLLLGLIGLAAAVARAQVIDFTITGTVTSFENGPVGSYQVNDPITVTFQVPVPGVTTADNTSNLNEWTNIVGTNLFTNVSIGGATGTWTPGSADYVAVESDIGSLHPAIGITADGSSSGGIGLQLGGVAVSYVTVQTELVDNILFAYTQNPVNVGDYFRNYTGTYSMSTPFDYQSIGLVNGDVLHADYTSLEIAYVAPVPEPASVALVFAAAAASVVLYRMRKNRARPASV